MPGLRRGSFSWKYKIQTDFYYSESNFSEYQAIVDSIGSVQFVDTGSRFRFGPGCYIGNRVAIDIDGTTFRKIDLDTLTVISSKSLSAGGRPWYFGENRILLPAGIIDFEGNFVTQFSQSFNSIVPGLPGTVRANSGYDIYKGEVNNDNITFTKIGTGLTDESAGMMTYGHLGAYLVNQNGSSGSGYSSYINPTTNAITNFTGGSNSRQAQAASGPDGKLYRFAIRSNGWGRYQKIGTGDEGFVGDTLSTSRSQYGSRMCKFLGNIVSGGMNQSSGTGTGYGSNNYFVSTSGTFTKVQTDTLPYDTRIRGFSGFIDEKGRIYPNTSGGGTGVILKTDKTFTNLNWKNPYLFR